MIRRTVRVLVVGAIAAVGLALPGTANAASPGCTFLVEGTMTTNVPSVVAVAGAIECATGAVSSLDNLPVVADPDAFIEVSMLYDAHLGSGWQACADSGEIPLVYGNGAAATASTCPNGTGYTFTTHLHAHIRFQTPVTSTPPGCVHDAVGSVWITCYAGTPPIVI